MKNNLLRRCFAALALALSLAGAPAATTYAHVAVLQKAAATATAPARAPQAPSQLADRTLANGLEVIVLEDHSIPLVTLELAVKNGSYTEPPELNGLSHLYEHMFFKANRAFLSKRITSRLTTNSAFSRTPRRAKRSLTTTSIRPARTCALQ